MKNISLFLLHIALLGCFGKQPSVKTGREGQYMPAFDVLLMDSTTKFNTKNIPLGQPTVFFIFSPNCPFCRAQTTEIIEESKSLSKIQFYLLSNFPFPTLKKYYEEYQLKKYPNIIVAQDFDFFFTYYLHADVVPYFAIYGKDKLLKQALKGKINSNVIKDIANN